MPKDPNRESDTIGVLFVCLGNICRSPLAEAIFIDKIEKRGLRDRFVVDSAGTGSWHVGERADPRTIEVASRYGIKVPSIGRQVDDRDFDRFDLLLAMDRSNEKNLLRAGAPRERLRLMMSFHPEHASDPPDVPDPYFGEGDGFEKVYRMLDGACDGLIGAMLER